VSRLSEVRSRLDAAGCDALLVTNLTNIRYLTGFTGSAGLLLVLADDVVLATDGRYKFQSAEQLADSGVEARFAIGPPEAQRQALAAAVGTMARLGLEAGHVTWSRQRAFAGEWFPGAEMVPTVGLVEELRRVKDAAELETMARAAEVADEALARVRALLREGPTEAEFGLVLDTEMRRLGATSPSFETIVASGPNGAKPHARPTSRRVEAGELVVLDFGALVDGYCSDMTRTVCVGEPRSEVLNRMVEVVAEAQRAGVAAVRAGATGVAVDRACREVIADAGWSEAFLHSTGHGVGLDIHEAPWVGPTSSDTLAPGHVVTVEPGIYLPEHGGVRIEDTVVVTEDGCYPLTHTPKDLILA
jgi:Xaa-Pro aminopeptidase